MCVNAPEYLEAFFAAQKLGAVPGQRELPLRRYRARVPARQLRRRSRSSTTTSSRRPSPTRSTSLPPDRRPRLLLQIASRRRRRAARRRARLRLPGRRPRPRARPTTREPSGDDLIFLYTGGTTGYPKAVMWRSDDLYVSLWQMARPGTEPPDVATAIGAGQARGDAATRLSAHARHRAVHRAVDAVGRRHGRAARHAAARSDAVWSAIEREHVQVCTIVGDAFARPLLAALDAEPDRWDLSSLQAITSSGVTWSPETKRGLLAHLPRRHADRLAGRVGRDHDAYRDARRRRHRAGALQGE